MSSRLGGGWRGRIIFLKELWPYHNPGILVRQYFLAQIDLFLCFDQGCLEIFVHYFH